MNLEIEVDGGILKARVLGVFSLAHANAALMDLLEAVGNAGVSRVLVDCSGLEGLASTLEQFQHATFFAEQTVKAAGSTIPGASKFAYVFTGAFQDPTNFGETVAVNRGANVRTFGSVAEAIDWLDG